MKLKYLLFNQKTPLHIACDEGNFDVVDFLVSKGAKINIKDKEGIIFSMK